MPKLRKEKAVFFDRDGTLINSSYSAGIPIANNDISKVEINSNAKKVIHKLKKNGYFTILVTNQPDVENGNATKENVDQINNFLKEYLKLDLIKVTYLSEKSDPLRYKPNPGMLYEAQEELNLDLNLSYIVGDRWRDIGAGKNAGCKTILMGNLAEENYIEPDYKISDLQEIIKIVLN